MEKMMSIAIKLKDEILLNSKLINKQEAMQLVDENLEILCNCADEIRQKMCENKFDLCSIVNGKSGKCSENCKFCAQSSFYNTKVEVYPLLGIKEMTDLAKYNKEKGVLRYSIVTSGRKLNDSELDYMCTATKDILESLNVKVCGSFGLLDEDGFAKIKDAGIIRIHNNLETSRRNFTNV